MALSISNPLLAVLGGATQAYGGDILRQRAQAQQDDAEQQRQLLAAAIARQQMGVENQYDLQRLGLQNQYETTRQNDQFNNEKALQQGTQNYDTTQRQTSDLNAYSTGAGEGVDYDTAYNHLTGVLGYSPGQATKILGPRRTVPGKTTTQLTPAGTAAFQQPQMTDSSVMDGGKLLKLLRSGAANQLGATRTSPALATGNPVPAKIGPLTQAVQGAPVADPSQVPFPVDPETQARIDAITGKNDVARQNANRFMIQEFERLMSGIPVNQRGPALKTFNSEMGTSFDPGYASSIPYIDKAGQIQAGIKNQTARAQAYVTGQQDLAGYRQWQERHGNVSQASLQQYRQFQENNAVPAEMKMQVSGLIHQAGQNSSQIDTLRASIRSYNDQKNAALTRIAAARNKKEKAAPEDLNIVTSMDTAITKATDQIGHLGRLNGQLQQQMNGLITTQNTQNNQSQPATVNRNGKTYRLATDGKYYLAQ